MAISRGHRSGRKFTSNIDTPHIKVDTQTVEEFTVSPDMMKTIKEALIITLKDKGLLKETIVEIMRNDPNINREIRGETLKADTEEIIPRSVDKLTAKREIQEFIKTNQGCLTSDIIEGLQLDPILVMEILKELEEQRLVENKPVDQ